MVSVLLRRWRGEGQHSAIIILVSSQSSQIQMSRGHSAASFASSKKFGGEMHNSEYQVFVMSQEDKSRSRGWGGGQQLIGSSPERTKHNLVRIFFSSFFSLSEAADCILPGMILMMWT